MSNQEIKNLLERIDIHYNTEYSKNKNLIKEWTKELRKYSSEDVNRRLEEHLRGDFSNSTPKLYYLIKGLFTPEQKIQMTTIYTNCTLCGKEVNINEFDDHYTKCSHIDFIKTNVKKYLNQDINVEEYWQMSEEDLTKRWEKIAKIVLKKSDNELLKRCLTNYFKEV